MGGISVPVGEEWAAICIRLGIALVAGGLIGLERSYHGRPAGFRTHTLVCMASAVLMLLPVYHARWFGDLGPDAGRLDPTRMAQGVMTGIGFLGAGVIMKDGFSVRGLTTAGSIWMTAAIGLIAGAGLLGIVVVASVLTLGTLSVFRWIEMRMPLLVYAQYQIRFHRDAVMPENELRALLERHGFSVANLSYRLRNDGRFFEYRMIIRTSKRENHPELARTLCGMPTVIEFRIAPTGD